MRNRELLYKYKGNRCGHCGVTVQQMLDKWGTFKRLFELDHIDPAKKHPEYENLIRRAISAEQLNEVDKCVLLCVECHKGLHAQNITAELLLSVTLADGREVSQRLRGQMIVRRHDMSLHFFTDEKVLVRPYVVQTGRSKPRLMTGQELVDGQLLKLFAATRRWKKLTIFDHGNQPELTATKINDDLVRVEYRPKFHLIEFEGRSDDGQVNLWARGGQVVYREKNNAKELNVTDEGRISFSVRYSSLDGLLSSVKK